MVFDSCFLPGLFCISASSFLRNFAWLGQYTFFFYCVHCFFLGLFRSTWTLGGSPSIHGVFMAFLCSCVCSWLFYEPSFFQIGGSYEVLCIQGSSGLSSVPKRDEKEKNGFNVGLVAFGRCQVPS